jgi:hypothetical protein
MMSFNNRINVIVIALVLTINFISIEAYTTSKDLRQLSRNTENRKIWNLPSPSNQPQDKKKSSTSNDRRGSGWKLSQAAVNAVDTTFTAPRSSRASSSGALAHGLLSPETVARMDEITAGGHSNEAVRSFLQTYRRQGPMSCLEMLSDPEVLPHLTQAMRDII